MMARSFLYLSEQPDVAPLVPPGILEVCRWAVDAFPPLDGGRWRRDAESFIQIIERNAAPGGRVHYFVRKRFIEEEVRRSLAEDIRQVVILGAGYDALAYRLHKGFPDVLFLEIDHPATQAVKRRALEKGNLSGNFHLLPADLGRVTLADALATVPRFRPEAPTLFVAEGVLIYLSDEEIAGLFRALSAIPGCSRFAFTFLEPGGGGSPLFSGAMNPLGFWFRRIGEPIKSGIAREALAGLLAGQGLKLESLASTAELMRLYLEPPLVARYCVAGGDITAVAVRAS